MSEHYMPTDQGGIEKTNTCGKPEWRSSLGWLGLLLLSCILFGGYCCELNRLLYQHQNPFYDSASYYTQLFKVMTLTRTEGLFAGLEQGCFYGTLCLPFIIAAVLGEWVEPSRLVGVWIQVGYLFVFEASLFYYLTRIQQLKNSTAGLGCFAFLTANCLFYDNGGLSDFRMDLGLCLAFGITVIWYLAAMARPAWWRFGLLGLAAGACCLARATAPIYLAASLLPLVMVDIILLERRTKKVLGLLGAGLTASVIAGWFYIVNFDYLYYYYVVWNTDANAKIPWSEAFVHIKMARRCIGEPLMILIVCWTIGIWLTAKSQGKLFSLARTAWLKGDINWRIAWIGICPIALMIARRAGLNPFVCMPAVIGLVLVFLVPLLRTSDRINDKKLTTYTWICLCVCLILASVKGWDRHREKSFNTMASQQKVIDEIVADSARYPETRIRFDVIQITELFTDSLYSILVFDRKDTQPQLGYVQIGKKQFQSANVFSHAAAADWAAIKGHTDQQKLDHLMDLANTSLSYVVIPDQTSAKEIKSRVPQNYINRHLEVLRSRVVQGNWTKISGPIQTGENEFVEIYRRLDDRVAGQSGLDR